MSRGPEDSVMMMCAMVLVLFLGGMLGDCCGGSDCTRQAVVMDKLHAEQKTTFRTVTSSDSKGRRRSRLVATNHPEHWYVIVRLGNNKAVKMDTSMEAWAGCRPGEPVLVQERQGRWTGLVWSRKLVEELQEAGEP